MKKRFGTHQAVVCFVAIAAWSGIANAQNAVYIGTDEFTTGAGTNVTFPFPTGAVTVQLKGKPLKGSKTVDTRVERTQIARFKRTGTDLSSATISIMLTALSLTGNVTVGTTNCTVDITLDPNNLANDTGSMTLSVTPNSNPVSGTFSSMLNVFYEATFSPAACPVPMNPIFGSYTMVQQQGTWSSVPPSGAYLTVARPANCVPTNPPTIGHCLGTPAQNANNHTGLPAGTTDFYLTGPGIENGPTASHIVCAALKQPGGTTCR
jgi:hypothetical protein